MVTLNPAADDFDAFVEHLGIEHRATRARWHLRLSGQAALPALRRGLRHPDGRAGRECVAILDHLADEECFPDVVERLDDDDPRVVARAVHTLACDRCKEGSCRPGESLWVLKAIELLASHPSGQVRHSALDALGKVVHHRPDAQAALEAAVRTDPHRAVRKAALLRLPGGSICERTRPRTPKAKRVKTAALAAAG